MRVVSVGVLVSTLGFLLLGGSGNGPHLVLADDPPASHVVGPEETVLLIARQYGVSLQALIDANGLLDPDTIQPGQTLTLPGAPARENPAPPTAPAPAGVHRVAPGDNLWSIAQRYGLTPHVLAQANGLRDADVVWVGWDLVIPSVGAAVVESPAPAPPASDAVTVYQIAPGDTIFSIARRFGITPDAVVAANGLVEPDIIKPGYELALPTTGWPVDERSSRVGELSSRGAAPAPATPAAPQPEPPAVAAPPPVAAPEPTPETLIVPDGEVFLITYYCLRGRMSSGKYVYYGAAAADASVLRLGTRVAIEGLGLFTIEDRFARDLATKRLDIWVANCQQALARGVEYRRVAIVD